MKSTIRCALIVATSAIAVTVAAPVSSHAQQFATGPGPGWRAWLGCWSAAPADTSRFLDATPARIVCVAPTADDNIVEISAIADGKILSRDRIDASGRVQAIDINGCTGSENAQWSADQRRVFLKSRVTCQGVLSEMSAVLAINTPGQWLDVRSTSAGGGANIRVARYRDVGIPDGVPEEIAKAVSERRMSTLTARIAAGAPAGSSAIVEASHIVDPAIVEEWIRASGQRFATDARTLTELADAGVPPRVTDAMVAVSNRTALENNGDDETRSRYGRRNCWYYDCFGRASADSWDQGTGQRVYISVVTYDPWGFGYWPFGRRAFDRGLLGYTPYGYAPYGLATYGFGGGGGYGYGDNYRGRNVGYYYPPTIVLHNDPGGTESRGRAEKGNGYTKGERTAATPSAPPGERTAQPRSAPTPPPSSAPAQAPIQASGGTSSINGDQSSGSSGRTAKARP
ncbi:MAG: hypothetical protein ABI969_03900 [bacterium]